MTDKNMKNALRIVFRVLINIVIILLLIQAFTLAYNFAYKVFTDSCMDPRDNKEIEFVIKPDTSTVEIVDGLVTDGLAEGKYVMLAKIYASGYYGKMKPGTYILTRSMTQDEILKSITGTLEEKKDDSQ